MKRLILLFIFPFLASSCIVVNSGNVSSGPLLNADDKYIDIAKGESKSTAVFGIPVMYSNKMILEAKLNLFKNRPLRNGEYYSNFSCDISKKLIFGIVYLTVVTVSAEVLKIQEQSKGELAGVKKDSVFKTVSTTFNNVIGLYNPKSYFINAVDSFVIGEKIFYSVGSVSDFGTYEITSIDGSEVSIKPMYGSGSNIIVPQGNILFSTKKSVDGFKVGEIVKAKVYLGTYQATIVAMSTDKALLRVDDEQYDGYLTNSISKLKKAK